MSRPQPSWARDLAELLFGYGLILLVLWVPESLQRALSPIALLATLLIVLVRCQSRDELGFGPRGFVPSLWILFAAAGLAALSVALAKRAGTLHSLHDADLAHVSGYVLWTIYQQFLLQDYFMPRLLRMLPNEGTAVSLAALLFATAHLPNLTLAAATLVWGAVSCVLFLKYRNIYILGIAQGLLGLCFAVCVPDALHHHMRVGLGYLRYHSPQPIP
jgi:hypothetical protein